MKYEEPRPLGREEAVSAIAGDDASGASSAIISLAFHDPDWKWVQDVCLGLLDHDSLDVRGAAVTALGHLARIHGELELSVVLPALQAAARDPQLSARVEDAIDDIRTYISLP